MSLESRDKRFGDQVNVVIGDRLNDRMNVDRRLNVVQCGHVCHDAEADIQ
jgi:hypothetical protein